MNHREIALIARELHRRLSGALIQKIHQPADDVFVIEFFGAHDGRERLLVDLRRGSARVLVTERKLQNPASPTAFCTLLRKLVQNGRCLGVEQIADDRLLRLRIDRMTETGPTPHDVVIELIPGYPVLFVLDRDDRILAASKAVKNESRELRRGLTWSPPPAREALERELPVFARFGAFQTEQIFALLDAEEEELPAPIDKRAIAKEIDRAIKKLLKKINRIEIDLRNLPPSEEARNLGELLKPSLHEVKRGMTEIAVRDWEAEGEAFLQIPLDPKLSPQENLDKLFHEARRSDRGRIAIEERLVIERGALAALRELDEEVRATAEDEIESLREKAAALGIEIKRSEPGEKKKSAKEQPRRPCFKIYRSKDGLEIRVGRSSKDNDELTFKHCLGNEWWLHAQDYAGSHVVVKTTDELPEQTLIDAATLAIQYSKARSGGKQAVSYTRRKNVSKFKGANPGQVQLKAHKTILVRFEEERLQRLESSQG